MSTASATSMRPSAGGDSIAASPSARCLRARPCVPMIGLLVVQIVVGYEWLVSGLDKFVHGGFPAGLEEELVQKLSGTAPWYGAFLRGIVIPNARGFGYAIEASELLAGIALVGGALLWLFGWERLPVRLRAAVMLSAAAAAIGGAFLALNLHFANGANHPWLVPAAAFDEGVDLDVVLPAIQLAIASVNIVLFRHLRRGGASGRAFNPT